MAKFHICSLATGVSLGVYEGETADEARDAMARDAGYPGGYGAVIDLLGNNEDLIVTEIPDKWVVEGRASGGSFWSTEYVGPYDVEFDTEDQALAAIDDLVRVCGMDRADLRVRRVVVEGP
jgi:hypothetical protein